jgi:predicted transcriptional regulator
MKELTQAEEQIMHILWRLDKAFVKEIIEELQNPKPAYNTVSTIVRILEKKGFVSHKAFGKSHQYFPLIAKEEYTKAHMNSFVKNYFQNSYEQMVSFFAREKSMSISEMEEILKTIEGELEKQKND